MRRAMQSRHFFLLGIALLGGHVAVGCVDRIEGCDWTGSCNDASGGTSTGGDSNGGEAGDGGAGGQGGAGAGGAAPCAAECEGDTPVCDEEAGECVGCLSTEDCAEGVCDPEARTCVGCLPGAHDTCGTGHLCNGELRECVEAEAGTAPTCGGCVADAHCKEGFRCVAPDRFGEEGFFCLPEPNPGCDTRRPFAHRMEDLATIDSATVTVRGHAFTSCAGFNDFRTAVDGCSEATDPPPAGEGNAACGLPGTADNTRCRTFEAGARCSYRCGSVDDCLCGFDCVDQVCSLTVNAEECGD